MDLQLYHYYDSDLGPFRNLSALPEAEAQDMLDDIRRKGMVFASKRSGDYMLVRRQLEARARSLFVEKGGKPVLSYPHYLTLGPCEWLKSWYKRGEVLTIPWEALDPAIVSFTYGDLFPTMRYRDDKPYREVVYRKDEIVELIERYGWPHIWNAEGTRGPERYIEAQVWDERAIRPFMPK